MMVIAIAVVVGAAFVVGGLIGSGLANAVRESRRPGLTAPRPGGHPERRRRPAWTGPLIGPLIEPESPWSPSRSS